MTENELARKHGIPKWLRRYQARYGKGGIRAIVTGHLQAPAPMLNHGRDRAARRAKLESTKLEGTDGEA